MALFTRQINKSLVLQAWTATAPAVAAPTNLRTTATTSSTASLAWDAVAGTYTLERALVSNGTPGAFATVYTNTTKSYTDGPLTFGATYAYRVLVTVNGVASGYSNVFAVQVAAPGALTVALTPADYALSATSEDNGTYFRTSSFAEVTAQTAGSYLDADVFCNWQNAVNPQDAARLQVSVNGVWQQQITMAQNEVATKRIPLSGTGTKTVVIRLSPQHRENDFGVVWCTSVSGLSSDSGITIAPPIKPADERIVLVGNSIEGNGTTTNDHLPWPMRFREGRGRNIVVEQWGSRGFGRSLNTPTLREEQAVRTVDYLRGAAKRINYVALITNDHAQGTTPADAAAYAGDYFDRVYAKDPSIVNYVQVPLLKFNYGAKTTVDTSIEPYRIALDDLKSARPWLIVVYAQSWLTDASQYTDWVHPNDLGHSIIESNFLSVVNGQSQAITGLPTVALAINPVSGAAGQARQFVITPQNLPGVTRADLYDDVTKQIVASSTTAPHIISFTPTVTRSYFAGVNKPGGLLYSNPAEAVVAAAGPFAPIAKFSQTSGPAGTQYSVTSELNNDPGTLTRGVLYRDIKVGDPSELIGNSNFAPYNITFTPTISGPYYMYYPTPSYNYASPSVYLEVGDLPAPFTITPRRANAGTLRTITVTTRPAGTVREKLWRDDFPGAQATQIADVAAGDPITFTPEVSVRFFMQFFDSNGQSIDSTNPIQALVDFP